MFRLLPGTVLQKCVHEGVHESNATYVARYQSFELVLNAFSLEETSSPLKISAFVFVRQVIAGANSQCQDGQGRIVIS